MSVPRYIAKDLTTEIPITFQQSASGQTVNAGATLTHPFDFNIQLVGFLNPFGLANPPANEMLCAGHVVYVMVRYAAGGGGGGGLLVELWATAFAGGTFRLIEQDLLDPTLAAPLAPGNGKVARYANAGACWALRIILRNTGAANATAVDYSIAIRAY